MSLWDAVPVPCESLEAAWAEELCSQRRAPALSGSGTFFVPTSLWIHLDTWTLVGRAEEGRPYASVEDHLQLWRKAENHGRQGLPKNPPARLLPMQPGYSSLSRQPLKAWEKLPRQPVVRDVLNAERQRGSTDMLLQPRGKGQGPNLSLQRSPVGAEE